MQGINGRNIPKEYYDRLLELLEAKYTVSSHEQLQEDFGQAKSYALRLRSKGLGLISKEGVWLSTPDYNIEKIRFWSWKQIADHKGISEIFDIAGNKNDS